MKIKPLLAISLLLAVCLLAGCKEEQGSGKASEKPANATASTPAKGSGKEPGKEPGTDPGKPRRDISRAAPVIGRGYDITSRYAYSPEIKRTVLDFAKLASASQIKKDPNYNVGEFQTYSGATSKEYADSLAKRISLATDVSTPFFGFKSEMSKNFATENYAKSMQSFATISSVVIKDAYYVVDKDQPEKLIQYATPEFLHDVDTQPASQIISRYGTHVMLGGVWGARLDHNFSAKRKMESSSESAGQALKIEATGSYKSITGGGGVSASSSSAFKQTYEENSRTTSTYAYGGATQFAQNIHNSQDYTRWLESIDSNIVWIEYYPKTLIPIYKFVADQTKSNALKNACAKHFSQYQVTFTDIRQKEVSFDLHKDYVAKQIKTEHLAGDKDVWSENGGITKWTLKVELLPSPYNGSAITARIIYDVEEGQGEKTHLRFIKDIEIPVEKPGFTILAEPPSWTGSGAIAGQNYDEHKVSDLLPNARCEFIPLDKLYVKIDGGNSNDFEEINAKGILRIQYGYKSGL